MDLQVIQNRIFVIRGCKVMLDFHLAEVYQVETKSLNLAVRRNIKRFPPDFMFQLSQYEWESLRFQFETSKRGGRRYLPYAFTELGATMLSTVLRSDVAIEASILVVRAFVAVRQLILNPPIDKVDELQNEVRELKQYVEDVFTDYNDINEDTRMQLELINATLAELQTRNKELNKPRRQIGFAAPQYIQR
ncbi:MAG: ORF6N domain-containing protein [Dysgonamonadaceae bacterium]|nr:ORF6N domain-containing protein [Dysgonamonadaceae bacterium]